MGIFDLFKKPEQKPAPRNARSIVFPDGSPFSWGLRNTFEPGYIPLSRNPEIITGCSRIADLISSMTIYLMANTEKGDVRIKNELSRVIDINPNRWMTRSTWMTGIVMNMLLWGKGNAIVVPHTSQGYLGSLEPIAMDRVDFSSYKDGYRVYIDGKAYNPDNLLHFVHNPHPRMLWKGQGYTVALKDVANSLAQANVTKQGFMKSEWKPSLVVKVDALADEFSSKDGRAKLLDDYITTNGAGQPWIIPADAISIDQVRPLSLNDLAIESTVTLDKKTVASILGVPPYLMGVGEFKREEWDAFINNTIRPICREIEQEMTRKLIISEKWYLMFNIASLYSYDLQTTASVYQGLMEHGIVTGNEVREKIGMEPRDGLEKLLILENYLPIDRVGDQKKLKEQ